MKGDRGQREDGEGLARCPAVGIGEGFGLFFAEDAAVRGVETRKNFPRPVAA
jgi:hypothetical protein